MHCIFSFHDDPFAEKSFLQVAIRKFPWGDFTLLMTLSREDKQHHLHGDDQDAEENECVNVVIRHQEDEYRYSINFHLELALPITTNNSQY